MAITSFPNDAVCYILADIPGQGEFQGSGVIIGPHTILTASHLLWDADAGKSADGISIYPGYVPNGSNYNPPGALGGTQAFHYFPIADHGGTLYPVGTQHDYAVIDTSADLSAYGQFALDPSFKTGDVIVSGYPADANGAQQGDEKTVTTDPVYSDLDTSNLAIASGYSGGPIWDKLYGSDGSATPAVTGIVSTDEYASKINPRKVKQIDAWIQSDSSLWTGGGAPSQGTVPQLSGTTGSAVNAHRVASSQDGLSTASAHSGAFADMVDILHRTQSAAGDASPPSSLADAGSMLGGAADPDHHHGHGFAGRHHGRMA